MGTWGAEPRLVLVSAGSGAAAADSLVSSLGESDQSSSCLLLAVGDAFAMAWLRFLPTIVAPPPRLHFLWQSPPTFPRFLLQLTHHLHQSLQELCQKACRICVATASRFESSHTRPSCLERRVRHASAQSLNKTSHFATATRDTLPVELVHPLFCPSA